MSVVVGVKWYFCAIRIMCGFKIGGHPYLVANAHGIVFVAVFIFYGVTDDCGGRRVIVAISIVFIGVLHATSKKIAVTNKQIFFI